jgi:hypothetical protein
VAVGAGACTGAGTGVTLGVVSFGGEEAIGGCSGAGTGVVLRVTFGGEEAIGGFSSAGVVALTTLIDTFSPFEQ